jgi:hypothetical protein
MDTPYKLVIRGEIGEPCGGPLLSGDKVSIRHLHRRFQPPVDVEQNPAFIGVVSYCFEQQIMRNAVEKGPDIKIQNPVLFPAAVSSYSQCVVGRTPRTIAVAVGMEDRL